MYHFIKKTIRYKLILIFLYLKKFRPEDSIIIFSEARGGSTWLMEILNKIPRTCINWEPLHKEKGVVSKELNWGLRPYIPKGDQNEVYHNLIKRILSFKICSKWSTIYLKIKDLIKYKIVITKFVRANLLLPYIMNNFKFHNKPILLIRHPIDVCISQIKAFDDDKNNTLEIPHSINNNRFIEHKDFIQTLETQLEYKIANWCLNNCLLLQDIETLNKVTIVFYSDLIMKPREETLRILKTLNCVNETNTRKILESINFRKPSKTDFKNNLISDPEKQLNKNFEKLNNSEKDSIQNIFKNFKFKLFDAYQPFPKKRHTIK